MTDIGAILEINFGDHQFNRPIVDRPFLLSKRRALQQGGFYPQGLLGLAYRELSPVNAIPLLDALVDMRRIKNIFSHCSSPTGFGGALMLGGILPYYSSKIVYTPIVQQRFYSVRMLDFTVNGKSLGLPESVYNTRSAPSLET